MRRLLDFMDSSRNSRSGFLFFPILAAPDMLRKLLIGTSSKEASAREAKWLSLFVVRFICCDHSIMYEPRLITITFGYQA
jgi:hypothetical protein